MAITPLAPPADLLADLASAVDGLQAEELHGLTNAELGARLVAVQQLVSRLQAESVRTLEVFDHQQAYAATGALSAASWLRYHCNLSHHSAAEQVRVARRLPELPQAESAFAAGEIGLAHVSLMAATADKIGVEPVREQEPMLVEAARQLDPRLFRQVTGHLRHCVDPDGALAETRDAHERRRLFVSEVDGVYVLNGTFDLEGGATICSALMAAQARPRAGDERSAAQRRADALVDVARRVLDAGELSTSGGQKPHLMVTADLATLAAQPGSAPGLLNFEQLIHSETVRRLACDASVSAVIVGSDGEPLSVGRATRTWPASVRRAMWLRDKHCQWPDGCDRPPQWGAGHHLWHWIDGGRTALGNGLLLCHRHHYKVHEGGWRLEKGPDGEWVAIPPWSRSP